MLVILKEDVPNLGFKDEIVTVKDGYGRNFLIPRGIAVIASEKAQKMLAEDLRQKAHKLAKVKADAEAKAKKLEGVSLTIMAKTSNTGTIYGAVTTVQIADELEALGHELNRKMIQIPGSIKEVGEYVAKVRLHKDVTVEVPFTVKSENAKIVASEPVAEVAPVAEEVAVATEEKAEEKTDEEV